MADSSDDNDKPVGRDYVVGYGRPPREHQFKPNDGRSRQARPDRKNRSASEDAAALLDKPLNVNRKGKRAKIHPHEAQMLSLAKQVFAGQTSAMREFLIECKHAGLLEGAQLVRLSNVVVIPDGVNRGILNVLLTQYGRPPWDPDVYEALESEWQRDRDEIDRLRQIFLRSDDNER